MKGNLNIAIISLGRRYGTLTNIQDELFKSEYIRYLAYSRYCVLELFSIVEFIIQIFRVLFKKRTKLQVSPSTLQFSPSKLVALE